MTLLPKRSKEWWHRKAEREAAEKPPRKQFRCEGCGDLTDGRHLDRTLMIEAEIRK